MKQTLFNFIADLKNFESAAIPGAVIHTHALLLITDAP